MSDEKLIAEAREYVASVPAIEGYTPGWVITMKLLAERFQAYRERYRTASDAFQGDIGKILDAIGHGSFARAQSPHILVSMEIVPSIDRLRARVAELESKLEAAEQHVTICQRANTEEVERRRKADSVLKRIHHLAHAIGHNTFVGLDGPDSKQNFAREIAEMALRESEEP